MLPYYSDELVTLYHGDAMEVMHAVPGRWETVLTDPVWPNAPASVPGHDQHESLIYRASSMVLGRADRLVVQLGTTSDPRWLRHVDPGWPYLMLQLLDYAMPSFRGRALTCDVAYAFGAYPPKDKLLRKVQPGRITCTRPMTVTRDEHPAPRAYEHVAGLVSWWVTDGPVLDPFCGSGTTLLACKNAGVPVMGIEREERFCEVAADRLRQHRMVLEL